MSVKKININQTGPTYDITSDVGYLYVGVATPTTDPGTPDGKVVYFANTAGTYTHFNNITVEANQVVALYNVNGSWESHEIADINITTDNIVDGAVSYDKLQNEIKEVVEGVTYTENQEYIYAIEDSEGKLLLGIKRNGKVRNTEIDKIIKILNSKVNKEDGLSLIDASVAKILSYEDNKEFIELTLDSENRVIKGVRRNGSVFTAKTLDKKEQISETILEITPNITSDSPFNTNIFKSNHIGINIHSDWIGSRGVIDKLCQYAKNAGVGIIRGANSYETVSIIKSYGLQVVGGYSNGISSVFEMNENGEYITDGEGNRIESNSLKSWLNEWKNRIIEFNGEDYESEDGTIKHKGIKIDYFETINEWDLTHGDYPVEDCFYAIRRMYEVAKEADPNCIITSIPLAHSRSEWFKGLLNYVDKDGKRIWDFFDILNFHYYGNPELEPIISRNTIWKYIVDNFDIKDSNGLDKKEIWIGEFGEVLYTEMEQARLLPKWYITTLAQGYNKAMYYQFVAYESNYTYLSPVQNYFGIIHRNVNNSYVTVGKNDGSGNGFFGGDKPNRIHIMKEICTTSYIKSDDCIYIPIHENNEIEELEKNGLLIGGKGYTLSSVDAVERYPYGTAHRIWEGNVVIDDSATMVYSFNKDIFEGNLNIIPEGESIKTYPIYLKLNFSNVKNLSYDETVEESIRDWRFEPTKAYRCLVAVGYFLNEGSTTPKIIKPIGKNTTIAYWLNGSGDMVICFWGKDNTLKIITDDSEYASAYDSEGNMIGYKDTMSIHEDVTYIKGVHGNIKISII